MPRPCGPARTRLRARKPSTSTLPPIVFSRQSRRLLREVRVVGLDGRLDRGQRQRAIGRVLRQRLRLHAAEHRGAAALPAIRVRHLADDVLVAALPQWLRMRARGCSACRSATNSAASKPSSAAMRFLQRVGRSGRRRTRRRQLRQRAIASRIAGVGRVTVSLRRSTSMSAPRPPSTAAAPTAGIAPGLGRPGAGARHDRISRKFFNIAWPCSRKDGFGMELHTFERCRRAPPIRPVPHAHDLAIAPKSRSRRGSTGRRRAIDHQRVVASDGRRPSGKPA